MRITRGNSRVTTREFENWLAIVTWMERDKDNRKTAWITMFFVQFPRERLALSGHVDRKTGPRRVVGVDESLPHRHFSRDTRRFDCISLQRYSRRWCVAMPPIWQPIRRHFSVRTSKSKESRSVVLTPLYCALTHSTKWMSLSPR